VIHSRHFALSLFQISLYSLTKIKNTRVHAHISTHESHVPHLRQLRQQDKDTILRNNRKQRTTCNMRLL